MRSDGSFTFALSRRAAMLLIAALVPAAAILGLRAWSVTTPEASAAQLAPAAPLPAAPMQAGTPGELCPDPPRATDYFLMLDGIEGESMVPGFEGQLEIESWSWGASNQGTHAGGGGGGAGKVSMQDFHFVVKSSKASPKLFLSCATGQHIKEAKLTVRKAGGDQQEYMTVKFTDLLVSSYQTGGSSGDVVPTDQISLNFAKVEYSVRPIMADGSLGPPVTTTYDVKKNVK